MYNKLTAALHCFLVKPGYVKLQRSFFFNTFKPNFLNVLYIWIMLITLAAIQKQNFNSSIMGWNNSFINKWMYYIYIFLIHLKIIFWNLIKLLEENWSCWNEIFQTNAGYKLWDKERSIDIREQLGIFNINDKLTQYKINWREDLQRMDDNRLPKNN